MDMEVVFYLNYSQKCFYGTTSSKFKIWVENTISPIKLIGIKFPFKRKACQVYEGGCCRQVSTVVSLVVW